MSFKKMIALNLAELYPEMKAYLVDRYASKYCDVVLLELRQAILRPSNENNELSFSTTQVYNDCGFIAGKIRLFEFMQRSPKTRLVEVKFKGNIGKYSRVEINEQFEEQIMNELSEMKTVRMSDEDYEKLREQANRVIPIDYESLADFLVKSRDTLRNTRDKKYREKIQSNIVYAEELLMLAEKIEDQHVLLEHWVPADTGREYGHSNSLQRMSKEVRHAALGTCHKYDFQAHSFAVMASIARAIDPTIAIAQIEDYIRYRTAYRKRIARDVGVSEEVIKTVFTSLGFGARPINNPYTSIRKAVYTEDNYNRLMHQPEFKFICQDLKTINDTVLTQYPKSDFTGLDGYQFRHLNDRGRKKTDSQLLAWIYQNAEAYITRRFIEEVKQLTQLEPLMTVHDCIYYKQKLPAAVVVDAQVNIRLEFPFVRVEHEAIFPIGTDAAYDTRYAPEQEREDKHRAGILTQEQQAHGYKSNWIQTDSIAIRPVSNPFAVAKELPDYTEYEYEPENYQ